MDALRRVWNKSSLGFPMALFLLIKIVILRVIEKINSFFWSKNLKKCGKRLQVQLGTSIRYPINIMCGDNISIGKKCVFFSEFDDSNLIILNGSQINRDCSIDFSGGLTIGEKVLISEGVNIMTHDHGYDPFSKPIKCKLKIENNVWIGAHAIILPQVEVIGENSIIAAGSIVTKSVESNTIVGGNPAKIIRKI